MKIINNIINTMIVILLMALVITLLPMFTKYNILTGSMEPTLHEGSIVIVNNNNTTPVTGDIIAFYMGNNVVIHRVQEVNEDGYITKGDANETPDPSVLSSDRIIGTLVTENALVINLFTVLFKYRLIILGILVILSCIVDSVNKKNDQSQK